MLYAALFFLFTGFILLGCIVIEWGLRNWNK
jgi:hypothetical protein